MSNAFEWAPVPMVSLSADGVVLGANRDWRARFPQVAFPGAQLLDSLDDAHRSVVASAITQVVGHAEEKVVDARFGSMSQSMVRFSMRWNPSDGSVVLAAHETVMASPPLMDRLHVLARVCDAAPMLLWAFDASGTFTSFEGKALELLGFRPGEAVGLNALDMFKDNPSVSMAITRALCGEDTHAITSPAPGVHFENWFVPVRSPETGNVEGAIGLGIDASERIRKEQDMKGEMEQIARQGAVARSPVTPILRVWDQVLCLPVIGALDSQRTSKMMDDLLEAIVRESARYVIVDLTGVEMVDTSTADHLIQLFQAAKVLGVESILCGIRPAVAQTIITLGLDLTAMRTTRSLQDGLKICLRLREDRRMGPGHGPKDTVQR